MILLARNADGLYWMSRYLERAEHLCRLLRQQVAALVDRPTEEIDYGWARIYLSLNRRPPGAPLTASGSDAYALANSYALADDLTFERDNPSSFWTCLDQGRENARQVRYCIDEETWLCLNRLWLDTKSLGLVDVWRDDPQAYYRTTAIALRTVAGMADLGMYRDERWHFLQLGRLLERLLSMAALMGAQQRAQGEEGGADGDDRGWTSLLLRYHAFDAYQQRHGVTIAGDKVLDLLAKDPGLPFSLCRLADGLTAHVMALPYPPDTQAGATLRRATEKLSAEIHLQWPGRGDRGPALNRVLTQGALLHERISQTYFYY